MVDDFIETGRERAARLLKKGGRRGALERFSRAFGERGDVADLAACIFCVDEGGLSPDDFEFDHAALAAIDFALFTKSATFPPGAFERLRFDLFARSHFALLRRMRELFDEHLTRTAINLDEEAARVLVISPQMLSLNHAPTLRACQLGEMLATRGGRSPILVNANAWPLHEASTFQPPWIANKLPYDGMGRVAYEGVGLPMFNIGQPDAVVRRLARAIGVAASFKPHVVVSMGDTNFAADLLSYAYPTVFVPTTSREPVTRAHVIIQHADDHTPLVVDHKAIHGLAPEVRGVRLDFGSASEKVQPQTRSEHGLPDGAFVIAMVGVRLKEEVTPEFSDALADILDAVDRAHLVFVGADVALRGRLRAKADRVSILGTNRDLSSFFELCDCYVDPPRIGGGRTAHLAAMELVPVVCKAGGDAASAIGAEHALPDLPAMRDAVIAMATDGPAFADWCARAERVKEGILARPEGFNLFLDCLDDARGAFERLNGDTELVAAK